MRDFKKILTKVRNHRKTEPKPKEFAQKIVTEVWTGKKSKKDVYRELHPGVTEKSAGECVSRSLHKYKIVRREINALLDEVGLTQKHIALKLKDLFDAKKIHGTGDDFIEVPDYDLQLKTVKEINMIRDIYPKENKMPAVAIQMNFTDKEVEERYQRVREFIVENERDGNQ